MSGALGKTLAYINLSPPEAIIYGSNVKRINILRFILAGILSGFITDLITGRIIIVIEFIGIMVIMITSPIDSNIVSL